MVQAWQHHWFSAMAALDGVVLQRVSGMTLVVNPHVDGPLQNFALWREVVGTPQEQLAQAEAAFASMGRAPAFWLAPEVQSEVESLLGERYGAQRFAVLWRTLADLPPLPELPAYVTVREITSAEVQRWAATLVASFGWTPVWQANLAAAYGVALGRGGSGYLLQRRGKPIGCGWLHLADGVAGLYAGGVLPAARGQGLGRALVLHRLHAARVRGAAEATLQVEPGGPMARICRALGFAQVAEAPIWVTESI